MGLIDDIRGATGAALQGASGYFFDKGDTESFPTDISMDQMGDALMKGGLAEPTEEKPRGLFHDPYSVMDWGGWRQRPSILTYDTLRQMTISNTVIAAIIQTRINQVAQFAVPQQGPYDKGYRVILRDRRDKTKVMSKAEQNKATELERMLETTGYLLPDEKSYDRDTFRSFLKKIVRDCLTYDQICIEKLRDRKGRISRFHALPAETIRPAVADIEHMDPKDRRERVAYVQVYEDSVIAEFGPDDLAWGVMNPRSDLRVNGFGYSPIEQIVRLVTAWLYGFEYNCLGADSLITTDRGMVPVEDLIGETFKVWDSQGWHTAKAVCTGKKQRAETQLHNGLELVSSPEHLFRTVQEGAVEPRWVAQKDLRPGDHVFVSAEPVDGVLDPAALFVGKKYAGGRSTARDWEATPALVADSEFWEMMGFALGDGHFGRGLLQIFPHYERDAALFDRFKAVCARHEIACQDGLVRGGDKQYPTLKLFHTTFMRWLQDVGFRLSSEGKRLPSALFALPLATREAFLRGLFSADGTSRTHRTGYRTPSVCVVNPKLRQDVLRLLYSCGVSAQYDTGTPGDVRVQDLRAFERVGFLQGYKNEGLDRSDKARTRWDLVAPEVCFSLVEKIRNHPRWLGLPEQVRGTFYAAALKGHAVSRPRLIEALTLLDEPIPEVLEQRMIPVRETRICASEELMFDIEVDTERSLFFGNGMGLHNTKFFSQGSAIKGVINVKGAIPDRQLRAFRRMWYSMVTGVQNSWKTPILNAEDLQWVSLHSNNREMEYAEWMNFLTKLICAVFGIDPMEINFIFGNTGGSGGSIFEGRPNEQEVMESKDKGLRPLIEHIEDTINHHIIWELEPDFEFAFTGLDAKAEGKERDARMMEVTKIKTIDEIRAEMDEPPLPDKQGEIILDPTFLQNLQGQQMEEEGGDEDGFGGFGGGGFGDDDEDGDGDSKPKTSEEADEADEKDAKGKKGGEGLPPGVKDGNKNKGQKEALAASMGMIRDIEVLRKAQHMHNGVQTIDVEIAGE